MKRIKIGQIGIGHNHGESKMKAVRKFPELFEVVGYAEENERWIEKRGANIGYEGLPRMSVEEVIAKSDAILVESDVWDLTKYAKMCVDAGKHIHMDKPASGTLEEYKYVLDTARDKKLAVQLGYMYRYNPYIKELLRQVKDGELGEIISVEAQMNCIHPAATRQWLESLPGGMMFYLGCHLVDAIIGIMGVPERIVPFNKCTGIDGVTSEDYGMAVFEYKNGVSFAKTCDVERGSFLRRQLVICGEKGTIEIKPLGTHSIASLKPITRLATR